MSLRLKIADMFREYPYKEETPGESADAVLALLRERLTSDAAVEAGAAPLIDFMNNGGSLRVLDVGDIITAALDAITKEPS